MASAAVLMATLPAGVEASDGSFTGPAYPIALCEVEYNIGGTVYQLSLPPQMIAETMGLPVSYEGAPAAQTLVVGEINGTPSEADIDLWLSTCGLTPQNWTTTTADSPTNANAGEATLDLTVIAGILPENVNLKVVNTGLGMLQMLVLGAAACGLDVNEDPATWARDQLDTPVGGCIITNSYGSTEQEALTNSSAYMELIEELMAGLRQAGVIVLFSAGDEGSGGCTPNAIGRVGELAPQWLASHPDVLSVGGTMWVDPAWNGTLFNPLTTNYVPGARYANAAWADDGAGTDCTNTTKSGTGGGISRIYAAPDYQSGVADVAPSGSRGWRMVPDIAALAGWPTWAVYLSGALQPLRGTSAATPLVAVGLAHVNAALTAAGFPPVDNGGGLMDVHSIVYSSDFRSAFTDVTMGSNDLFSLGGWNALSGYDMTTGWGVPDFTILTSLLLARARAISADQVPPPILQQVALPASGECTGITTENDWAGVGSGGWSRSWAQWPDGGNGGAVCTRTLVYRPYLGRWAVA